MNDHAPAHEPAPKWMWYMLGVLFLLMIVVFAVLDDGKPRMTGEDYAREREIQRRTKEDAADLEKSMKKMKGESLTDREKEIAREMAERNARAKR